MSRSETQTARTLRTQTRRSRGEALPAPLVLGRYRLHRRLGAGAFGTVWLARDERLEREVAVKILPRERIMGGRFEREARAAARLAHPGIVTLYEAAVDDDGAYLVSELVRGSTFDDLLDQGQLSDRAIVAVGVALCDALAHAHAQSVIHRDVKPSNILVPEQPPTPGQLAKLTDFGVARVVGGDSLSRLTRTGDVVGTLAYMAPEQAEGLEAGAPADLYSLALVLYEALTGINPVKAGSAAQRARRLGAHLPPLRRQRRDLPRELAAGIDMALRPRPRERGTIKHLRRALVSAHAVVGDEAGVVGEPWYRERTQTFRSNSVEAPPQGSATRRPPMKTAAAEPESPERRVASARRAAVWAPRGLAALAGAVTAGWLTAVPLAPAPLAPPAAGLLAAAAVLLLPRLGWLALTISAVAVAVGQHHPGAALVIATALLIPVALNLLRPSLWPLATAAPALGLVGLAGAWPALSGRARTPWRRAALGGAGWIVLLLAAPLAGRALYLPLAPGTTAPSAWAGSLPATVHGVLVPVLKSGALAGAPVWAAGALVAPWLVRGRSLVVDLIAAVVWSAVLVSATQAAVAAAAWPGHGGGRPSSAATGAVLAAVVALAPTALSAWRHTGNPAEGSEPGFP